MMTESEQLDQALTEADARKWRYKAEQAEAALARSETHLKLMQAEMDKIARNLGKEIELLARAEQAEAALATERMALREFAKAALFRTMSDLSEACWCAGWMDGTEFFLWDAVEKNEPALWGMDDLRQRDIDDLRRLRELAGGWWVWDDEHYETFVSIDQMTKLRQQKVQP